MSEFFHVFFRTLDHWTRCVFYDFTQCLTTEQENTGFNRSKMVHNACLTLYLHAHISCYHQFHIPINLSTLKYYGRYTHMYISAVNIHTHMYFLINTLTWHNFKQHVIINFIYPLTFQHLNTMDHILSWVKRNSDLKWLSQMTCFLNTY